MKRLIGLLIVLVFCLPVASSAQQDVTAPRVEITGVNANDLPTLTLTANVFDAFNQPVRGLEAGSFELTGPLAEHSTITSVQNLTDNNLPFGVVLAIDVSSSMTDQPISEAKLAAQTFVDAIGANNPIALYTFASKFTLIQDFTSDKAALRAAIDSIVVGGQTGLYQAAYNAIDLAASMDIPRRAVILLSDGAEYGGISQVTRQQTLDRARARGVPVYTVGLGYGVDRSYLKTLAEGTNAQFFESPDPQQLTTIYNALATLLRSQYVITVQADIPLDGTEYDVNLQVTTPDGVGSATTTLRAPIPAPIITLPDLSAPITEKFRLEAAVKADDPVQEVTLQIDGGEPDTQKDAPYTFNIDPLDFTPGPHQLEVRAVDEQGDVGSASATLTVAALPPQVNINSNFDKGPLENVQSAILDVRSQTPVVSAVYTIDGENPQTVTEAPYKYDVQPLFYKPGEHQLSVTVTNQSGQSTSAEQSFTVASLPPYVVVSGLEEGQTIDAPLHFKVDTGATQSPVNDVTIKANGVQIPNHNVAADDIVLSTAELDPHAYPPGTNTLSVTATNADGKTGSTPDIHFEVPALPPIVVFSNLSEGQPLSANLDAEVSFISQTPITLATYLIDDQQVRRRISAPWNLTLDVLALGPGSHTLRVVAEAAGGQQSTGEVHFVVTNSPSLTATALVPTRTPTPTINAPATATEQAVRITATAVYEATIAAATQAAQDATATQFAVAAAGTAYAGATGTSAAVGAASARSTAAAQATSAQQLELDRQATATQSARAQITATADAALTATSDVRATQDALAEQRAQGTANAQSTQSARATTRSDRSTATAAAQASAAQAATATQAYRATVVQQSLNIRSTATENAHHFATATVEQATQDSQVTAIALAATASQTAQVALTSAAATATQSAQSAATQAAQATATDVAQATATQNAQSTATQAAQATATRIAQVDATQAAQATATDMAQATATQAAVEQATATDVAQATATQAALEQATATQIAFDQALATRNANATATRIIQVTMAAQAEINARSTVDAQATRDAVVLTQNARSSATAIERQAEATQTRAALNMGATMTVNADATRAFQLAAIGALTVTPTPGATTELTAVAQIASPAVSITPPPTLTPMGTLVPVEIQSQSGASANQLIPLVVIGAVLVILLLVIFLIIGRRRRS